MGTLRPSVCIDAVFEKTDPIRAVRTVKDCGIDAFEFWGWWDRDLAALTAERDAAAMQISACCTRFVSLVDPQRRGDYLSGLEATLATCQRIGVRRIITQVGDCVPGMTRGQQRDAMIAGLKSAAPALAAADVTLMIEPLNERVDHAGYFLVRSDDAFEIIDAVGSPHVKVVFDLYHQQISEGDLIANVTKNIDKIAHFHAAGNPGRHELNVGEIDYRQVFEAISATEYDGFVGLEYWPTRDVTDGLRTVAQWFG